MSRQALAVFVSALKGMPYGNQRIDMLLAEISPP